MILLPVRALSPHRVPSPPRRRRFPQDLSRSESWCRRVQQAGPLFRVLQGFAGCGCGALSLGGKLVLSPCPPTVLLLGLEGEPSSEGLVGKPGFRLFREVLGPFPQAVSALEPCSSAPLQSPPMTSLPEKYLQTPTSNLAPPGNLQGGNTAFFFPTSVKITVVSEYQAFYFSRFRHFSYDCG